MLVRAVFAYLLDLWLDELPFSPSAPYQTALRTHAYDHGVPEQDADQQQCNRIEHFGEHPSLVVSDAGLALGSNRRV